MRGRGGVGIARAVGKGLEDGSRVQSEEQLGGGVGGPAHSERPPSRCSI